MKCDICSKPNATVHLTEIIDNKISKLHLCEECAKKKGAEMEEHFGLSDLLAGLADFDGGISTKKEAKVKCPSCGLTYDDFKKTGRLGCDKCYSTFQESLLPLIKRIHGSTSHLGKSPSRIVPRPKPSKAAKPAPKKKVDKITDLKNRLDRAIKMEEFEEAARLRDKIKDLGKKS